MSDTLIYPNGIDAETGEPLLPPLPVDWVAALAQGQPVLREDLDELRARTRWLTDQASDRGTVASVDPNDLAQAGWGVIFAFEDEAELPALREALAPLLNLRREQAREHYRDETVNAKFFYRPGESKNTWLTRNGGAHGPVDPLKVPYYLLLVGDPAKIPYRFQYQLDVAHAVGRIHFDTLDEYDSYARSVVAAEQRSHSRPRQAAFFGVRNGSDLATQFSSTQLVEPLAGFAARRAGWQVQHWSQAAASKEQLARLLGGDDTPAFLFAAGHGMGFDQTGHPRQRSEQGALVCSDWPGQGAPQSRHYLAADDIGDDARLQGLIAFLFACYGAGTPQFDDFALRSRQQDLLNQGAAVFGLEQFDPIEIAPQPFVARLPQRLLGHPRGGALAVVGHVDRAWGFSFLWENGPQLSTFESALTKLLRGDRLGVVMEDFNNRYAELSSEIADRMEAIKFRHAVEPEELARLWTANNDARNYVVLGDPAVKLAVAAAAGAASVLTQAESITVSAAEVEIAFGASLPATKVNLMATQPPSRTIFALFVGIDDYAGGVNPLKGCVNDVTRLHDLLAARVTGGSDSFNPLVLANAQATRQGIIDAWRGHLGQAGPGDVALFCYAGHGSQENAPPEFWDFEPDHLNETLVCHDSRAAGGWDLADKELAQLIAEVAANGPHFAVILDCCHSGSGTRDAEDITVRQQMADRRTRPIANYIVTPEQVAGLQGQPQGAANPAMPWAAIASGRHILLAACRPEQTAKETAFPGPNGLERRGAFSFYLQDTLQQTGAALSYRDLFKRINALVQQRVADQHPQLEASEPDDLDLPFLGGAIPATPATFTLSLDKDLGWVVDAGAVHGIPQPVDGGESTQLAIFPFDAELASLRSLEQAIGQASITEVLPGQSLAAPVRFDGTPLNTKTTYKALVTSTPLAPLAVAFEGDTAALELVRKALANFNGKDSPSLLVRESDRAGAEYRLLADAENGRYRIRREAEALRFAVDTPGLDVEGALIVAQRLEHIARWASTARLSNPGTQLSSDAVQLEIYREQDSGTLELMDTSSGVRFSYEQVAGDWQPPRFRIHVINTLPDQRLFCMLLDLTESYSVYPGLLPKGGVWLEPHGQKGSDVWARVLVRGKERTTLDGYIPDNLFTQYVKVMEEATKESGQPIEPMQLRDILKLIVSTDEADATLLKQGELPVTFAPILRGMPRQLSTLNRLMARVNTRDFGSGASSDEAFADWTTVEVATTVVRPVNETMAV